MTAAYNYSTTGTSLVNAIVNDGQHVSSAMDFYQLYTLNKLQETNYAAADAGQNLIRLCEIIGTVAQPIQLRLTTITAVDLTNSGNRTTYGMGTSIDGSTNSSLTSVTIYQFNFTFEHTSLYSSTDTAGAAAGSLANQLFTETAAAALPFTSAVGSGSYTTNAFTFLGNSATLANTSLSLLYTLKPGGNIVGS